MRKYQDTRAVAVAMQLIGWFLVLPSAWMVVAAFARGPVISEPYPGALDRLLGLNLRYLVMGICIVAAGQALRAIADMATNSWHLRQIAESNAGLSPAQGGPQRP